MPITETINEGLKRAYTISVTAQELATTVETKLKEAQPSVEMKGFRKGKVPMAILKRQFGQKVMGEAMQEAIDGQMQAHLKENNHRPAQQPDMKMVNENWKEGDDIEVSVSYECLPEVPETDFSSIELERLVVKATDGDVSEALSNIADSSPDFKARRKGSKAKDGDQVIIDFLGKVDGDAFDGGSAEDYPLVLGSDSFIPGFEKQLIGVKAGEDVCVNVTFPSEYNAENLAGKDAVFECKIKEVKAPKPAEIDDELAKKFGVEDLETLKNQIIDRLEGEFSDAARMVLKRDLMDALDSNVDFDLPEGLVTAETNQIAHQLFHEENPDVKGHDHDPIEPTQEHKTLAIRRVRLGLLLAEIGQIKEITISDTEMQQAVIQQAQQYGPNSQQFVEFIKNNPEAQQQIRAPLFENKVIDYILSQAKVTDKEISKEELKKSVEALDD